MGSELIAFWCLGHTDHGEIKGRSAKDDKVNLSKRSVATNDHFALWSAVAQYPFPFDVKIFEEKCEEMNCHF